MSTCHGESIMTVETKGRFYREEGSFSLSNFSLPQILALKINIQIGHIPNWDENNTFIFKIFILIHFLELTIRDWTFFFFQHSGICQSRGTYARCPFEMCGHNFKRGLSLTQTKWALTWVHYCKIIFSRYVQTEGQNWVANGRIEKITRKSEGICFLQPQICKTDTVAQWLYNHRLEFEPAGNYVLQVSDKAEAREHFTCLLCGHSGAL